jgi:hypothetical protein
MSWSTDAEEAEHQELAADTHLPGSVDPVLAARTFSGDLGVLPLDTRRVIVQLLLGPAVDAQRQNKLWSVLLRDEHVIRSRLHELFLELVMDHDQQVAYTRQVVDPELEVPVLLRKVSLTFLQSALLLFLREQLIVAEARGERAVVSRDELLEHLSAYQPPDSSDHAKFAKQAVNAVERAKERSLVRKLRGAEERYEVSPTLKLLFPAEEIQALTQTYQRLAQSDGSGGFEAEEAAPEEEEEDA